MQAGDGGLQPALPQSQLPSAIPITQISGSRKGPRPQVLPIVTAPDEAPRAALSQLKIHFLTLSEPNMLQLGICSQDPKGCCQEGPSQQVSGRQGGSAGMPVLNGTMLGLKPRAAVGAGMPSRLRRAPESRV